MRMLMSAFQKEANLILILSLTILFVFGCSGRPPKPPPPCNKADECINISRNPAMQVCGRDTTGDRVIRLFEIHNDHPKETITAWVKYNINYLDNPRLPTVEGEKPPIPLAVGKTLELGCEHAFGPEGLEKHRFWLNKACFSDENGNCKIPETGPGDPLPPPAKPRPGSCEDECSNNGAYCIAYKLNKNNSIERNMGNELYLFQHKIISTGNIPFSVDMKALVNLAPGGSKEYGPMDVYVKDNEKVADASGNSAVTSIPVNHSEIDSVLLIYPSYLFSEFHRIKGKSVQLKFNRLGNAVKVKMLFKDATKPEVQDHIVLIRIEEGEIEFVTAKSYCIRITSWGG